MVSQMQKRKTEENCKENQVPCNDSQVKQIFLHCKNRFWHAESKQEWIKELIQQKDYEKYNLYS